MNKLWTLIGSLAFAAGTAQAADCCNEGAECCKQHKECCDHEKGKPAPTSKAEHAH